MKSNWDTSNPEERKLRWIGVTKFLFIVILTLLIYLLAHSMVRHRFFKGGWMNQNDSVRP
jgi:hypothetical protein